MEIIVTNNSLIVWQITIALHSLLSIIALYKVIRNANQGTLEKILTSVLVVLVLIVGPAYYIIYTGRIEKKKVDSIS